MAEESLFTSWTPGSGNENDGAPGLARGLTFVSTVPGNVLGVRFFATTTTGGTETGFLYEITAGEEDPGPGTGTELAAEVFAGPTVPATWNEIRFVDEDDDPAPVAIEANTPYKVVSHNSQGRYVATLADLLASVTVGNLTAIGANESGAYPALGTLRNGTYEVGAAGVYPNEDSGAPNYGVDVIFEAASIPAEGSAALTLDLAAATTGARQSAGGVAAGLALAIATAGDAPAIPPSEGSLDTGLVLTLAASGDTPAPGGASGSAALTLDLAAATAGDSPSPGGATGQAALGLALTLAASGDTPAPGTADGSAALGLVFTVTTVGSNGQPVFPCRPVRSFAEVLV